MKYKKLHFFFLLAGWISIHADESSIPFDRIKMWRPDGCIGRRIEGYWSLSPAEANNNKKNIYPFPIAHTHPWPGKDIFLKKLHEIEISKKVEYKQYRGLSPSRLVPGKYVGSGEFIDKRIWGLWPVIWPQGYKEHYIAEHNVIPSQEFYRYVMNFTIVKNKYDQKVITFLRKYVINKS